MVGLSLSLSLCMLHLGWSRQCLGLLPMYLLVAVVMCVCSQSTLSLCIMFGYRDIKASELKSLCALEWSQA